MELQYIYVPHSGTSGSRKGFSERMLRRRLEKHGWQVWRGGYVHASRKHELYPNVERAYTNLAALLDRYAPGTLEMLQYLCVVHHGMPDFICFRAGQFKFVECKLEHEQLLRSQKNCFLRLVSLGFRVEVHKLVDSRTKIRRAQVNLLSGEKTVAERQLTLTQSLFAGSRRSRAKRQKSGPR